MSLSLNISFIKNLLVSFVIIFLTACGRNPMDGMIIITVGDVRVEKPDFISGDSWRYVSRTGLVALDPFKPSSKVLKLTEDFYSARSPEVSYDGKHILFAGQKSEDEPWQIWEMDLRKRKSRQLTFSSGNSVDPAYLPGNMFVFSNYLRGDSLRSEHALFTCNTDGKNLKRITFNPHTYFASSVLRDGRIITISRQVYPAKDETEMMVMRPDGTKSELFYKGKKGSQILSRPWETGSEMIVFTESPEAGSGPGKIISVKYNRPLSSRTELTQSSSGDYRTVFPLKKGMLLVTFRPDENGQFGLYEFDPGKMSVGNLIYSEPGKEIIEAVEVAVHERPRKLPSEVDPGVKTGLLLCQNINVTGMTSPETGFAFPHADRIEVIGIDSSLGVVEVEGDGSVYLKLAADMPFRIRTMDKNGKTVNGPGGWYWLRPNERRGCIGCHEDNEMVPANRYAKAVSKDPVTIPVHITGIKEKEIELE